MKIVSLLPAATEIVSALGLCDCLAGRSHECDFPEGIESLPALTKARIDATLPSIELDAAVRSVMASGLPIYMLDEARLAALAPDVVVTQAACEACAISLDQVRGAIKRTAPGAKLVSLQPARLGEILENVLEVAEACGVRERGERLVAELRSRLDAVAARAPARKPRVAVVEWLAPPMLAGHWVPETIASAGALPVGPAPGTLSRYATWDEIGALAPDAVVVAPCGFDLERTLREAAPLAETLRSLAPRVLLLDGNAYLNRPGPRIIDAVETLAAWLQGEQIPRERGVELDEILSIAP